MERNLYLHCLKGSGWTLDGLRPIKGRHFFLRLHSDDNGYPIEDGMYKITDSCEYDGIDGLQGHEIHISFVNNFIEKGYVELVEDPTDYSEAKSSAEIMASCDKWSNNWNEE